jgi:putative ABC transport system ATP-binding protein
MIRLEEISKTYSRDGVPVTALRDASFAIAAGEFVVIRGVSGSGKSTLLNILGCLDSPTTGTYMFDGADISHKSDGELSQIRSNKIGFIFQSFNLLPRTTAVENVELPMIYANHSVSRSRAVQMLVRVGLAHRENHYATELSGGEQQRVAIARSLINDPALILADEPTGNLDESAGAGVMNILHELNDEGKTIILVTHDDAVASHARRVLLIRDGQLRDSEVQA